MNYSKKEVDGFRNRFHKNPELGFKEFETSKFLKLKLEELGFKVETVAKTGVLAFRKGNSEERAICFRADMDALNITEESSNKFKSVNGCMHACGHDGHMAILSGFATYISKLEEIKRDIILLFQPAEENLGGGEVVLKDPIFRKYNIECIFGLHLYPELEEGKIGIKAGTFMSQIIDFDLEICGEGAHGAQPDKGVDAIYVSAQIINAYQSIISRGINPAEAAVITIGNIQGGRERNQIPEKVTMEGTIRTFNMETYKMILRRIDEVNLGLEKMYSAKVKIKYKDFCPPVVNDKELANQFVETIGEEKVVYMDKLTISEDFGFYQTEIPGMFFMLGCRNEELGFIHPLHSPKFDFSEEALYKGVDVYIELAQRYIL